MNARLPVLAVLRPRTVRPASLVLTMKWRGVLTSRPEDVLQFNARTPDCGCCCWSFLSMAVFGTSQRLESAQFQHERDVMAFLSFDPFLSGILQSCTPHAVVFAMGWAS